MSQFLVIEGLIGVGKTTLCRLLGERWSARLVLEPWEANPFLANFYADPERFAFPAQMFYLATRYSQQLNIRQGDLFAPLVVADYLFDKDRIFAEQTLDAEQKKYALGASTIFLVIQAQRDLAVAQAAEVNALSTYSRARVSLDQSLGATLDVNNVSIDEARKGSVSKPPSTVPMGNQP